MEMLFKDFWHGVTHNFKIFYFYLSKNILMALKDREKLVVLNNIISWLHLSQGNAAAAAAAAATSLQLCPTLCDPIDASPPGSPIPGILHARILEWVAISFSNAWKWKVKVKSLSRAWLLATPWTGAYQAPPSMGFSRQEYWSGVPLPSPNVCVCIYIYL